MAIYNQSPWRLALTLIVAGMSTMPGIALAGAVSYVVDSKHTYASFEINHLGLSTARGTFDRTSGTITLDAENGTGEIRITIDTASIDTGLAKRDEHLRATEFFNVDTYPNMTFTARELEFDAGRLVKADGQLTLLGRTLPVSLRIGHFACGEHPIHKKPVCGADAETRIRRSEWGMAKYVPIIGDEVTINIGVEAFRVP
ncbi:MAG TPA: YceI family protein [Burkholderiales bacterium]|nr:YceI family protein [Burkholderiales bacterium]